MPTPNRAQAIRIFEAEAQTSGPHAQLAHKPNDNPSLSPNYSPADDILALPITVRLLDDLLTPVAAYRRLVEPDDRDAPSFLFESVEQGRQRYCHRHAPCWT